MINRNDWCAAEYIQTFGKHYIGKKGTTISLDHRIDRIYSWYSAHRDEAKTYLLSNSIVDRVQNMDISKLSADMILTLANNHNNECGVILDPKGQPVKVSCAFLIQNDCILIEAFRGNFSNAKTIRYSNGKEDLTAFSRCFAGCVIVSPAGIEKIPNNTFMLLQTGINFRIDEYYKKSLQRILKEISKLKNPGEINIQELIERYPSQLEYTRAEYNDLSKKTAILNYALKSFLYIFSSETIKADYISEGKEQPQNSENRYIRDYYLVDSLWDTEVNVLNPFGVSGHFTHQPYGKGSSLRKLIYIEPYMKQGYHRKATKDIISK